MIPFPMTASDLLTQLIAILGKPLDPDEGFRFGNPSTDVKAILVCWMCDPAAIAAAATAGASVIICHEALYFPYDIVDGGHFGSRQGDFLAWPTNHQRVKLLAQNDITVIRLHGSVDRLCIFDAFTNQLGLGNPIIDEPNYIRIFQIPPRSVHDLARDIKHRLGLPAIRAAIKDPARLVTRIGVPWGGMGLFVNVGYVNSLLPHRPEVLIAGETDNYGFRFATELGIDVIETSHEISEHKGLEEFAQRIGKSISLPVTFFPNPMIWKAV
jgi:putative NIF3 family GTP cyclohydrolase 1 type 2